MRNFFTNGNIKGMTWLALFLYVVVIIFLVCLFVSSMTTQEKGEKEFIQQDASDYYALTCKVVEIDRSKDIVTMADSTGNTWQFYGVEDWEINDCVSAIMNDCGTASIFDDEIVSVKYSRWTIE